MSMKEAAPVAVQHHLPALTSPSKPHNRLQCRICIETIAGAPHALLVWQAEKSVTTLADRGLPDSRPHVPPPPLYGETLV